MQNDRNMNKKRERKTCDEQIGEARFLWFTQMRSKNVPLHGPMIFEKVHQIAIQVNCGFKPNPSWLKDSRKPFNSRNSNGRRSRLINNLQKPDLLTSIHDGFTDETIYNADETSLFYEALPTGTLSTRDCKTYG